MVWFGICTESLTVIVRVILPPGIKPDEVLSQDVPFTNKEMVDDKVVVEFKRNYPFSMPFRVGVSFPSRNMTGVIQQSTWDLITEWYEAHKTFFNFIFIPFTIFFAAWALIRAGGKGCVGILLFFILFYFSIGKFFRGPLFLFTLGAAASWNFFAESGVLPIYPHLLALKVVEFGED